MVLALLVAADGGFGFSVEFEEVAEVAGAAFAALAEACSLALQPYSRKNSEAATIETICALFIILQMFL